MKRRLVVKCLIVMLIILPFSCSREDVFQKNLTDKELFELFQKELKAVVLETELLESSDFSRFSYPTKYAEYVKRIRFTDNTEFDSEHFEDNGSIDYDGMSILKPECFEFEISEIEKSLFSYIVLELENKSFNEKILVLNFFDNFIHQRISNAQMHERLLYLNAALKRGIEYRILSTILNPAETILKSTNFLSDDFLALKGKQFDRCFDQCMVKKIKDMNAVDWIFAAYNPPMSVIQMVASCSWSCAKQKE
jgi:hypothetical protein